eukprot:Gregarina_sp_Pseudo_9__1386@NODE_1929_length_1247_cov_5_456954_g1789_i0_p7_GENE_NODE_1929_length_1247_cov_5_456954_g1789_i0NODE_1929_length_1247_cov_5_456954_g1789_i0_p7_ORF_typecomplete_len104_score9_29Viral_cys_rich/PF08008_12/0_28_NODE_1929_length_1247_cov_5_456954_g1789_i0174485
MSSMTRPWSRCNSSSEPCCRLRPSSMSLTINSACLVSSVSPAPPDSVLSEDLVSVSVSMLDSRSLIFSAWLADLEPGSRTLRRSKCCSSVWDAAFPTLRASTA